MKSRLTTIMLDSMGVQEVARAIEIEKKRLEMDVKSVKEALQYNYKLKQELEYSDSLIDESQTVGTDKKLTILIITIDALVDRYKLFRKHQHQESARLDMYLMERRLKERADKRFMAEFQREALKAYNRTIEVELDSIRVEAIAA